MNDETVTCDSGPIRPSLAHNSFWNLVAFASTLVTNIIILPFIVRWVGLDAFGNVGIILAICAPLILVGTVLGQALTREISVRQLDAPDYDIHRLIMAAIRLCLVFSVLGWLLLFLTGPLIYKMLVGKAGSMPHLQIAFILAASGWFMQQLSLVLQGICAGRQNFRKLAKLTSLASLLNAVAILGATWFWPSPQGYLGGMMLGYGCILSVWLISLRRNLYWQHLWSDKAIKTENTVLLHFGKWQGLAQLASAFGNQIDRYALGAMAPVAVVGHYNIAMRLQEAAYIGVVKAGEVLFPHFGSISSHDTATRSRFFQTSSWVMGMFSAVLLGPMAILSMPILSLWVGPDAAAGSASLLTILVLGSLVGSCTNVFVYYAMGMGQNTVVTMLLTAYSALTVILSVLLIGFFGPSMAGVGILLAGIARTVMALIITKRRFFPDLGWGEIAVNTSLPSAVAIILVLLTYGHQWSDLSSWPRLFLGYGAISLMILGLVIMTSVLVPSGRNAMERVLLSVQKLRKR